ncbi:hypothetical protein [Tatumella citrea]|uniref:Lipoprotein n=1 Tax=Tatumella citrea TaxID=53336 RepID=A0A1Y0LAL4_TATCI|nr:hypothetical protein [Tatumella citrea]ARU94805.1 hypothetical protein A7K98_14170 [Tatumella citrea]ARU98843.1 hypothetical protein A7K99_14155 [Tatumella citrea]
MTKNLSTLCVAGLLSMLLSGCAHQYPGGYAQVDSDKASNSLQFRYKPTQVNLTALNTTVADYCHQHGFDKVEPLPEENSAWPGDKTRWFQCNYSVEN